MIYNTNITLTYPYYDHDLRKNLDLSKEIEEEIQDDVEDLEEMTDLLYKIELLKVFHLDDYYEGDLNKKINELFDVCVKITEINELIDMMNEYTYFNHKESAFAMLFSFHYFYLFHPCLKDYLTLNKINENNYERIKNKITQF